MWRSSVASSSVEGLFSNLFTVSYSGHVRGIQVYMKKISGEYLPQVGL